MLHLGDITKISGYTAPIVDCIIGGSPCQDLSVAGRREGLKGERSGLYMEQIRLVKEMRERDERNGRTGVDIRPRYMVWENVPGAFSSNKGEDFRIVLEELAKVKDENAVIPMPDQGKWTSCGCIVADGWSIAWRVLDAQFWGVPQRRRRIALVADFGGESAPEILFVRKSLSGNTDESKPKRKESAPDAPRGIRADDSLGADQYNLVILGDTVSALGVNCGMSHGRQCILEPLDAPRCYDIGEARLRTPSEYKYLSPTLSARCGTGGNNTPAVVQPTAYTMQDREGCAGGGKGALIQEDRSAALRTVNSQYLFQPVPFSKSRRAQSAEDYESWAESDTANTLNAFDIGDVRTTEAVVYAIDQGGGKSSCDVREGKSPTLTTTHDGAPVIALDRASFNQGKNAQYDFEVSTKGINSPLVAKGPGAVCYSFNPTSSRDAGDYVLEDVANPLINGSCPGHKNAVCYPEVAEGVVGTLDAHYSAFPGCRGGMERTMVAQAVDCRNCTEDPVNDALQSNSAHSLNGNNVVRTRYIVRRLSPKECERLQGYPDNWTDIGEYIDSTGKRRQTSDAARYKALGNSIALPPWKWVLKRICACYERDATMASLFDGIGGFPYLWEQINGKGSCLWASEVEEFPIAVTKKRIGE